MHDNTLADDILEIIESRGEATISEIALDLDRHLHPVECMVNHLRDNCKKIQTVDGFIYINWVNRHEKSR